MLSVEHVTKRYGNFTALEDVSLSFGPGVYGLLAPNGAGKTTLIKMLTTLLFPTSGQILWNGEDIRALDEKYRAILGYLPQEFGYYPYYTPRQFLRYAAALQCIAQAMLNEPEVLILDEPTAGLDPRERVRFRNLIHSLASDRIVILSTHIVSDIETIAGQIVMFRDHKLYCCDSSASICARFQGQVFEVPAGTAVQSGQFLLSERQGEQGPVARLLCGEPPEGGVPAAPGLEDAFLAIYREGAV